MYKKVLVVDDNQVDRYIAEIVMSKYAFAEQIVCLESAPDALEYLIALESTPEELPELIFLDINMPFMSGFDFLNEYESLSEAIKKKCIIMMLTTSLNENDRVLAEANKYVCSFLNKPLNKEKIDHFDDYQKKHH
ncbi:MAG: cheB 1 [Flavipsychrobacter sp.]|nr:cheB 1 [Flavipsychrobacter sp.]